LFFTYHLPDGTVGKRRTGPSEAWQYCCGPGPGGGEVKNGDGQGPIVKTKVPAQP